MFRIEKKEMRLIFRRFLFIFLPLVVILGAVLYIFYTIQEDSDVNLLLERSSNKIDRLLRVIESESDEVFSDLLFLSRVESFQDLLDSRNLEDVEPLQTCFLTFASSKHHYDQLRFIDANGMERVRVNSNDGHPYVVPEEELQSKVDRYYFVETMILSKDEIYVSPLDLNVENGKVEVPLKPMIRVGIPVYDSDDNKRGVLILNYLAESMFEYLDPLTDTLDEFMLLNSDGYWLYNADTGKRWGFMFDETQRVTFGADFPEEWETIESSDSGQFRNSNGLFTFRTIYPLLEGQKSSAGASDVFQPAIEQESVDDYFWKAIVYVSTESLDTVIVPLRYRALAFFGVFFVIIAIGSWLGARAIVRRNMAEAALQQMNDHLEGMVADRTAELKETNEKLIGEIAERHIAEQQNTMKSEFLSFMSHEIRTPLNSILGFSEILLDGIPGEINDEQKDCLTDINDAGKHLLELINDLLDISKIEAGKMIFKPAYFNLVEVIQDVEKTLNPLVEAKRHTLEVIITEETAQVFADQSRVRQVLLNLLSNSIKYTLDGGEIKVTCTREGDFYRTVVSDNGIGIREEDQKRLFEVFIQAETLQEESLKGTGLGLALTKQLVEAMGGQIGLESTFGEGSSFYFTLPIEDTVNNEA